MWTFLLAMCIMWVTPVRCTFHGRCPRKEPPPGVVVVFSGSDMVLTCSGHVIIDGVKVTSNSNTRHSSYVAVTHSTVNVISHNAVLQRHIVVDRKREEHTVPTFSPTHVSHPIRRKSEWDSRHMELEDKYDEEEDRGGGVKSRSQWKWNGKDLQGNTQGSTLFLSHVRMSDSGRYSCYHGGTETFSTRITVAETPETPHLSCYKKSPSSKIRCEWTPHTHVQKGTSCSLLIRKGQKEPFIRSPCSYSTRRSRCWCALDHNEDDKRTLHKAFLCVTSVTGNATSEPISFTPMDILKPDPPYNVSVQQELGLNKTLTVTWKPPYTWKFQDRFYELIYEIQYKPIKSANFQTTAISEHTTSHTITDAEAGREYEVQVRAKDEYEGDWSEWSPPKYGSSWTDSSNDDLFATPFPYPYIEGSGTEDFTEDFFPSMPQPRPVSHHYVWISVSIGFFLAILAVYIIRSKDKCMSKLQSLGVLTQCSDSLRTLPAPAVAGGHALLNKDRPLNDVKDKNVQKLRNEEMMEAITFNNSSYFLVQRES